jgi:hypothetical protein
MRISARHGKVQGRERNFRDGKKRAKAGGIDVLYGLYRRKDATGPSNLVLQSNSSLQEKIPANLIWWF